MKVTYTRAQFDQTYPNSDVCLDHLFQARYGRLAACPGCGVVKPRYYRIKKRKCYECKDCSYQLSPTADTIFHKSSTSLKDWFYIIYLFSQAKNGVSAMEIQRHLGVTYKCAWRIGKQIRLLMAQDDNRLDGIVEGDETYVGGKRPRDEGRGHKTPVLGLVERGGAVRAQVTTTASTKTAQRFIEATLSPTARLHTDESPIYHHVAQRWPHETINHSRGEYARGLVTTNTIEGFWSQLKRSLHGTYHAVSPKYLQGYVDYFAFHYTYRSVPVYPLLMERAWRPVQ